MCCMSTGDAACIIPLSPPIVKRATKLTANSIGVVILIDARNSVADQFNTFTPVGIAISIVIAVNTPFAIGPNPTANM